MRKRRSKAGHRRHHNNDATLRIKRDGHLTGLEGLALKLTNVPLAKGKPRKEDR